ncbi:MAG: MOSC domain-containing protein [Bacteroidetes bacterium]|nr:MAG: MOSC domain-containing protein [Bacteroidota bacterium]
MQIISTNLGKARTIIWRNKEVQTGFYKTPVNIPIYLGKNGVANDKVVDTKVHGGSDKASYLFSEKHYTYWKNLYPSLDWQWGMFGENLTILNLDETKIRIGDTFQIGEAQIQASQPRQPCYKLGVRFNTQKIVQQFVDYQHAGIYIRVLKEGFVKTGDKMELLEQNKNGITIKEIFRLLYSKEKEQNLAKFAVEDNFLAESCKKDLIRRFKL